jgi:hypothetical protein
MRRVASADDVHYLLVSERARKVPQQPKSTVVATALHSGRDTERERDSTHFPLTLPLELEMSKKKLARNQQETF